MAYDEIKYCPMILAMKKELDIGSQSLSAQWSDTGGHAVITNLSLHLVVWPFLKLCLESDELSFFANLTIGKL